MATGKETDKQTKIIALAMREALATIAQEQRDAKHVLANDAAIAARQLETRNADGTSDHDVQVKLVQAVANLDRNFTEKFLEIRADIKELKDGTSHRIECLETEKLNIKDSYVALYKAVTDKAIEDLRIDVKNNSTWITRIVAYGSVLLFLVGVVEFFINKYL